MSARTVTAPTAAVTIAAKDLRQRLRDRSAFIVGFLAPFGLALIMSATFGGGGDDFGFEFAYADRDGGEVAAGFVGLLDELDAGGQFTIVDAGDEAAARALADQDQVAASFVVPAGMSDAVTAGADAEILVIANPEAAIGTDVAAAIARGYAARVQAVQRSVTAALAAGAEPADIDALARRAAAAPPVLTLGSDSAGEGGFDFATYYAVGIAVFFLFFTVQYGVLGLVEERDNGTLARLLSSPIAPAAVVGGKVLAAFVLGITSMATLVIATTVVLGASWGPVVPVSILVVLGVLSAMGIVAVVGGFARNSAQAESITSMVAIVMAVFGGSFFPISFGPAALDVVSRLTPHRWLLDGFRELGAGGSLADVTASIVALSIFAVVTGVVGLLSAKRLVAG
ncbi:MAG: ABC transporter permease [Acidimicrobiales bacterium]